MSAARGKGGKAAKAQALAIKWLQCDLCEKWRRIPAFVDISAFEGKECVRPARSPFAFALLALTLPTPHATSQVVMPQQ